MFDLLETLNPDTGAVPERRIDSAQSAYSIWWQLWQGDQDAALDRSLTQGMFDGQPPYAPDEVPADCCNVNFNDSAAILEHSLVAYDDLINSVPQLFTAKTRYGNEQERVQWGGVIGEEFSRMVKEWDQFQSFFQPLCRFFISEGVSVAFFPGDIDWRPSWTNLEYFKVNRGATTDPSTFEVFGIVEDYLPHKLYRHIKNAEQAEKSGWNVEAVRKALMQNVNPDYNSLGDWEKFERQIKDNDLYSSYSSAGVVKCAHILNIEFDGTVSHYIILRDGDRTNFLFEKRSRFKSIYNVVVPFFYGVGNGDFHSIRGLGFKIFALMQAMNRLKCSTLDSAQLSSTIFITPSTEDSVNDIGVMRVQQGITVLPSGMTLNQQPIFNVGNNALPIISQLSSNIDQNIAQYKTRSIPMDTKERTRREVEILSAEQAVLSTGSMNLFYTPWGKLGNEMFRRAQNKDYRSDDPGGREIYEFRKRLVERGVPLQALYDAEGVTPVRAIGYGSAGNRMNVQSQLLGLSSGFDEIGRYNAKRNMVSALVGFDQVDQYVAPMQTGERQPVDMQIAVLEEGQMKDGTPVPVIPGQNNAVHLEVHIPSIVSVFQMVQQGALAPEKAFAYFNVALPHNQAHLQQIAIDPSRQQQVAEYSQILNQVAQTSKQIGQQLQEQMQQRMQAAQGQPDVENQLKIQKAQLDNQIKMAKANLDMQLKQQKAIQNMAIKDAQSAQKIRQKSQDQIQDMNQSMTDEMEQ